MTRQTSATKSILLMLSSVILFAANVLIIRGLSLHLPQADGWVASLFRGVVGMLIVSIIFTGRGLKMCNVFTRPLLLMRGVLGGLTILAFYITVVHLGAARAVVINLSYPMFGSLIAATFLKEHLPLRAWLWMLTGFSGLVVFLGGGLHGEIGFYDFLGLAGAIGAGGIIVLIRQLHLTEHTSTIYISQCIFSVVFAAGPAITPALGLPPSGMLVMMLAAAIVAVAQLAMTHAYRELAVARGSAIQMLLPIFTAIGGFFFFGESFTIEEIGGATLTLFSTWQVVRSRSTPKIPSIPSLKVKT